MGPNLSLCFYDRNTITLAHFRSPIRQTLQSTNFFLQCKATNFSFELFLFSNSNIIQKSFERSRESTSQGQATQQSRFSAPIGGHTHYRLALYLDCTRFLRKLKDFGMSLAKTWSGRMVGPIAPWTLSRMQGLADLQCTSRMVS